MHALLVSLCRSSLLQLGLATPAEDEGLRISGFGCSCILSVGGISFSVCFVCRFFLGCLFDLFDFLLRSSLAHSHLGFPNTSSGRRCAAPQDLQNCRSLLSCGLASGCTLMQFSVSRLGTPPSLRLCNCQRSYSECS